MKRLSSIGAFEARQDEAYIADRIRGIGRGFNEKYAIEPSRHVHHHSPGCLTDNRTAVQIEAECPRAIVKQYVLAYGVIGLVVLGIVEHDGLGVLAGLKIGDPSVGIQRELGSLSPRRALLLRDPGAGGLECVDEGPRAIVISDSGQVRPERRMWRACRSARHCGHGW